MVFLFPCRADHEMALRLQQEDQQQQPQQQQQQQQPQQPNPVPQQQPQQNSMPTTLEELYRAHQQGVRLSDEQTRQLNAFLSQRGDNGECQIM